MILIGRLAVAWTTVALFLLFGDAWLADLASGLRAALFFFWLFVTILWCAFGVVEQADHLADMLGDPLGSLVLTLSIVIIEVALIAAVAIGSDATPTLGRDTMFGVLMIALNGGVGLALLLGGLHHREQAYNLQGAVAYLAVIIPLSSVALILPNFTQAVPAGSLTVIQAAFFSLFTILLYAIFLLIQTRRHQEFFVDAQAGRSVGAGAGMHAGQGPSAAVMVRHTGLLLVTLLPIVLLSGRLATLIDHGTAALAAPSALGGVLIAVIVFAPEGISALAAARANQLQRSINLCLGAAASTIGLTVPAILIIGLVTGKTVILGLDPTGMTLLALTLILSTLTFSGPRTTVLEGAVHLVVFLVYVVLIFSP
ncbi:calcium:proton antiporter [Variovorax sp. J31P207]|uniref:calcium:proton antiporter n=1 Tax=Variovorax sp. J31P207 TaxID=3053510 RepID=UPI002578F8FE|nr:calcium:proton antiporter [Variovorax sp. J31P207]MDM0068283.1 calcium:proton antiporter [Variovorax sp. J31P207]